MATVTSEFAYIQEARTQLAEALISKFGVQRKDILDTNGKITTLGLYNSNNVLKRLHDWTALVTSTVTFGAPLIFKSDGGGAAPDSQYNGAEQVTISYNTIGAAASGHNHTSLSGVTQINFKADTSDRCYIGTTVNSTTTTLDFYLAGDASQESFRWIFADCNSNVGTKTIMQLFPTNNANTALKLYNSYVATQSWVTSQISTALKSPYSFTVFGVSYDGSSAKAVDKTTFISTLTEGTSSITDGTMLITSWASNNGFADSGGVNVPYKRKAIHLWEYINGKTNSLYVTSLGTSDIRLSWTKSGTTNYITIPGTADNGVHAETASGTTANAPNTGMLFGSGMYMTRTYTNSGMPCNYGNVLNMAGGGSSQLLLGWSRSDSTTAYIYYRSHRDTSTGGWGSWRRLFYADELPSSIKNPNAIKFKDISDNVVSYDGSFALDLTAGTYIAKLPYGFSSWASGCTWGNTTGTSFASWNDSTGGSIDFRRDNPSSGKMSIKVDGRVYVNEGINPVLSAEAGNGFWGMRTPDGKNNWIRTPDNGLIPYMSGSAGNGHSSLGTSTWYFSTAYIDNVYGNATTATYATKLQKSINIWGQSFDGSADISGNMTGVGDINTKDYPAGTIYTNNWYRSLDSTGWYNETYDGGWYMNDSSWIRAYNNKGVFTKGEIQANYFRADRSYQNNQNGAYLFGDKNAKISYIDNEIIFNTGASIRFGATDWYWDKWAGLKYDSNTKYLYLGLADGSVFTAVSGVSGGSLQFPGIANIYNAPTINFDNVQNGTCNGLYWTCGDDDFARIRAGATGSNAGYLEIATADDGTEPIYVRQYTGVFSTVKRTLTLLDACGNTYLPGHIAWGSWEDTWSDDTHTHPWYGFDHRYHNTGKYSTTLTDYYGMTIKTAKILNLEFEELELNGKGFYAMFKGIIVAWSGFRSNIPDGWVLCNGANGTPNLGGRFILGYQNSGTANIVGSMGGEEYVTLLTSQIPSHSHAANHRHKAVFDKHLDWGANLYNGWQLIQDVESGGDDSGKGRLGYTSYPDDDSNYKTDSTGGGNSHNNMPPYYVLCFIMFTG